MSDRPVTHTRKDNSGNITAIGKPGESWSPRTISDAIRDIETGVERYYVPWPEKSTWIEVVNGANGKYLRADRDSTTRNNLDDLPSSL